jgi:ABC-type polysaccharide/polyol phosphate export permease
MHLNPLSYGLNGLRGVIEHASTTSMLENVVVSTLFAIILFAIASAIATGRSTADVQ